MKEYFTENSHAINICELLVTNFCLSLGLEICCLWYFQNSCWYWFGVKMLFGLYRIYGLLTKRGVKMAGYWPSSFLRDEKNAKKNEANIQPS